MYIFCLYIYVVSEWVCSWVILHKTVFKTLQDFQFFSLLLLPVTSLFQAFDSCVYPSFRQPLSYWKRNCSKSWFHLKYAPAGFLWNSPVCMINRKSVSQRDRSLYQWNSMGLYPRKERHLMKEWRICTSTLERYSMVFESKTLVRSQLPVSS